MSDEAEAPKKPFRILALTATNVLRLSAVALDLGEGMTVIGGANGAGKSSVLGSVAMAINGADSSCQEPIRKGEESASVVLDLGDIIVERKWDAGKPSRLTVSSKEGAVYKSPQAILDRLRGAVGIDVLAWLRLKPRDQLEQLQKLVGLDLSPLNEKRANLYAERATVNKSVTALGVRFAEAPQHPEAPAELVSAADLLAEMERRERHNADVRKLRADAGVMEAARDVAAKAVAQADAEIVNLERALADARTRRLERIATHEAATGEATKMRGIADAAAESDVAAVRAQLGECEAINQRVRENAARAALGLELNAAKAASAALTSTIEGIDAEKAAALAAAPFPVPGLGFGDAGVTYQGVPFEQASSGERLRVAMAMAIASAGRLHCLLLNDASLLDDAGIALVAEMAEAAGMQILMERVGEGAECQVIIEEGAVKEVRPRKAKAAAGTPDLFAK